MRVLLQRVKQARVTVDSKIIGDIGSGLLLLIGISHDDNEVCVDQMAEKIVNLRIFEDENEKMNLSALDVEAEILVVSQFTLYADTSSGRRPGFSLAAKPEYAEPLIHYWVNALHKLGITKVATGEFGAHMEVELVNDGPVTIMLESDV